jgi:hypothetical protein
MRMLIFGSSGDVAEGVFTSPLSLNLSRSLKSLMPLPFPNLRISVRLLARGGIEKLGPNILKPTKPGRYSDGGNLYFEVKRTKKGTLARSWTFRSKLPGRKERDMGLGGLDYIGMAKASRTFGQQKPQYSVS